MTMHPSSFHAQRERGVALVVSMVMLVAITIIGVFVMNSSHLEWLMSNNSRFQTDAEMRAEAALRDGEKTIENPPSPWDSTNGLYNSATLTGTMDPRKVSSWANLNTLNATTLAPAQYVVESLGASCLGSSSSSNPLGPISCGSQPGWTYLKIDTYRVWALATDGKGLSEEESGQRLEQFGPNALPEVRSRLMSIRPASPTMVMLESWVMLPLTWTRSAFPPTYMGLSTKLLPTLMLSGFIFPISGMPMVLQWFAHIIPATYYLEVIRGVMLTGEAWYPKDLGLMLLIGVFLMAVSMKNFRSRLD